MLKYVESHESKIHSFLCSVKSACNHTVPIIDEVELDNRKVIVMPRETVLSGVLDQVFETSGNDLAHQFLEGVHFMHRQCVAHLDLKPSNILVTLASPLQLHIIDFGISVRVSKQDAWITGYRGTEGWAAPEVVDDSRTRYQPIRADLWSAGRVLLYFAHRQHASTTDSLKSFADKLLRRNPLQRPLLSEDYVRPHLCCC